jgi:hypothetical protein
MQKYFGTIICLLNDWNCKYQSHASVVRLTIATDQMNTQIKKLACSRIAGPGTKILTGFCMRPLT